MLDSDQNAMTEVALALAMAFFAIFVLAAVSMSQPVVEAQGKASAQRVNDIAIADSTEEKSKQNEDGARVLAPNETFYAFYQGRYFTQTLQEAPLADVQRASVNGKVVLAVNPSLPMQKVLQIKQKKNLPNLSISLLNEAWISRLEAL